MLIKKIWYYAIQFFKHPDATRLYEYLYIVSTESFPSLVPKRSVGRQLILYAITPFVTTFCNAPAICFIADALYYKTKITLSNLFFTSPNSSQNKVEFTVATVLKTVCLDCFLSIVYRYPKDDNGFKWLYFWHPLVLSWPKSVGVIYVLF